MNVIDKVRKTLRAATNKKKLFRKNDSRGLGYLTNIEFKNALRKLGIGLSSNEID